MNYEILKKHATSAEVRYIDAVKEHGSNRKAAKALGVSHQTIGRSLARLEKRAARVDTQLHDGLTAPRGFFIPKVTIHEKGGQVVERWVRNVAEGVDPIEALNILRDALDANPIVARPEIAPPKDTEAELLVDYVMGDPHLGMHAWGKESGADFDLKIGTSQLLQATQKLVVRAPAARTAIIWNVGDFFHADDSTGRTKRSGHILDTDTRWGKVLMAGVDCKRACIDAALERHEIVYVYINRGNHDDHSAWSLLVALMAYYHNNPRVIFQEVIRPYQYHEFGVVLFGTTHGDLVKPTQLAEIMAADCGQVDGAEAWQTAWSRTRERYWICGHVHHDDVKEYRGVTVEHYNTLAAPDAWNHAAGYRSKRSMRSHVYHSKRGRIDTHIVGVQDLT